MKRILKFTVFCVLILAFAAELEAALYVKMETPKIYGQKSICKIELQNTFSESVTSTRAVVFLMDDNGKVVGQQTHWILGGTKSKPPLAPNAKTTFNFVIQSEKPFTKTKIIVTRIVLESGKLGDLNKDVVITTEGK